MVKRRYVLWSVLVFLNALIGLAFSLRGNTSGSEIAGVLCAVVTFMGIYIELDYWLARRGLKTLQKRLVISALVRACLQFTLYLDIMAGAVALSIVSQIIGGSPSFTTMYLTVIVDGLLLSVVVAIIMVCIHFIMRLRSRLTRRGDGAVRPAQDSMPAGG